MSAHHFWVSLVFGDSVGLRLSSSGQDYVAGALFSCHLLDRITSLALRFPLPYHGLSYESKQKRFLRSQKAFFCAPASLMRASSQRSTGTQKNTQLPLSAFACFRDPDRIRTCDPQLRRLLLYPAELPDQSFICSSSDGLMSKEGAKIMLYFYFANRFLLLLWCWPDVMLLCFSKVPCLRFRCR